MRKKEPGGDIDSIIDRLSDAFKKRYGKPLPGDIIEALKDKDLGETVHVIETAERGLASSVKSSIGSGPPLDADADMDAAADRRSIAPAPADGLDGLGEGRLEEEVLDLATDPRRAARGQRGSVSSEPAPDAASMAGRDDERATRRRSESVSSAPAPDAASMAGMDEEVRGEVRGEGTLRRDERRAAEGTEEDRAAASTAREAGTKPPEARETGTKPPEAAKSEGKEAPNKGILEGARNTLGTRTFGGRIGGGIGRALGSAFTSALTSSFFITLMTVIAVGLTIASGGAAAPLLAIPAALFVASKSKLDIGGRLGDAIGSVAGGVVNNTVKTGAKIVATPFTAIADGIAAGVSDKPPQFTKRMWATSSDTPKREDRSADAKPAPEARARAGTEAATRPAPGRDEAPEREREPDSASIRSEDARRVAGHSERSSVGAESASARRSSAADPSETPSKEHIMGLVKKFQDAIAKPAPAAGMDSVAPREERAREPRRRAYSMSALDDPAARSSADTLRRAAVEAEEGPDRAAGAPRRIPTESREGGLGR